MKTQLFIWKHVKAQVFAMCLGMEFYDFLWIFWHTSDILCCPLDLNL